MTAPSLASDVNPLRVNDIVIWGGREWSVRMALGRADGIGQDDRTTAPRALWATLAEYPRREDSPLVERYVVYWRAEAETRQLGMTSTPIPDGEVYRTGRRLQLQDGRVVEVRS